MSNHHKKRSVGERGGEFILIGVYLIGDVWGFWEVNHLLCLSLAALGIFGLIWYDDALDPRQLALFGICLVVVAIVVDLKAPPILPMETEGHGWLLPADEPIPPNMCKIGQPPTNDAVMFLVGGVGLWTTSNKTSDIFKFGNCTTMSATRSKNGLLFDFDLFGKDGNLTVRIQKNEFHLISGEYSYIDRSNDRSVLAVYDQQGHEIVRINYINPHVVLIKGIFYCAQTPRVVVHDDHIIIGNNYIRVDGGACHHFDDLSVGMSLTSGGFEYLLPKNSPRLP